MSTLAGVFSETLLQAARAKAEVMAMDARLIADTKPWTETVRAIMENTKMKFGELTNSQKDYTVEVEYSHLCTNDAGDYTSENYCATTCGEPSTNIKEFTADTPIFKCFTIKRGTLRGNDFNFEELYAQARIMAERYLLELLAQRTIAVIEANLGANQFTTGKGTVLGTNTTFASAFWSASLVPELMQTAVRNKFESFYLLDSGLLYNAIQAAAINSGNANGSGDARAFGMLKYYADLYNIDIVNTPDRVMYMIDSNAIGLTSKTRLPNITKASPEYYGGDEWRWSENGLIIPGLVYDIHRNIACDTETDEKNETFKVILRPITAVNPTGCDSDVTGLLKMLCATAT